MKHSAHAYSTKWRLAWRATAAAFNPKQASTTIKAVGGLGLVLMIASTCYGLYAVFHPFGRAVELSAGYLLGFLFAALLHDLACAVKSEESELRRYLRLAKGTTYSWLAWLVFAVAVIAVAVLIYLQATVAVTRATLYASIIGAVMASEFSMMYINSIQSGREARRRAHAQRS